VEGLYLDLLSLRPDAGKTPAGLKIQNPNKKINLTLKPAFVIWMRIGAII